MSSRGKHKEKPWGPSGGPIYQFSFWIFRFILKYYFRKISLSGTHHIPLNRPVILAANHNNAFLDSIVLHIMLRQNIYTLARGDAFKTRLNRYLLSKYHILPIFRISEGAENLHRNQETFRISADVLNRNAEPLLIFPEGICVQEKRLRPLKKGMARIAFMSAESKDFSNDVRIIPVGINYSRFRAPFGRLHIVFHQAIKVNDYRALYEIDKSKAITSLTRDTEKAMLELVEEALPPLKESTLMSLFKIKKNEQSGTARIIFSKSLSHRLTPEKAAELDEAVTQYERWLKKYRLRDSVLSDDEEKSLGYMGYSFLLLALITPVALIALVAGGLPVLVPPVMVKTLRIPKEFRASFYTSFIFLLLLLQSIAAGVLGGLYGEWWTGPLFIACQFPAMMLLKEYRFIAGRLWSRWIYWWLKQLNSSAAENIRNLRKQVQQLSSRQGD